MQVFDIAIMLFVMSWQDRRDIQGCLLTCATRSFALLSCLYCHCDIMTLRHSLFQITVIKVKWHAW